MAPPSPRRRGTRGGGGGWVEATLRWVVLHEATFEDDERAAAQMSPVEIKKKY